MKTAEPTATRSREGDVHPLRLRLFLEKLSRRLSREELEDHLAALPPTRQEICRTVQSARWLPADEERAILEALGAIDRAYLLLEETGQETFFAHEDIARLRPTSDSIKNLLFRLPGFLALCCTHLGLSLRFEDGEIDIRIRFNEPFEESHVDLFFLWGFFKAVLFTYRVSDYDLALTSTALRRDSWLRSSRGQTEDFPDGELYHNVFHLRMFHGSLDDVVQIRATLAEEEPLEQDWARQVKARTADLLQDNRELLTAVEYLNMANDELERKIMTNQRELDIARHIQRGFV